MTTETTTPPARRPGRLRPFVWGVLAALLSLPLIAMQFTAEVDWSPFDFLFMGVMLSLVGGGYELAVRLSDSLAFRAAMGLAVVASFLLVWINLAVGIIGSEDNPANQMFVAVLAVLFVGSLVAGFKALRMAYVLAAVAATQVAVAVIALVAGFGMIFPITAMFCAFWLLSAWLFRKAGAVRP